MKKLRNIGIGLLASAGIFTTSLPSSGLERTLQNIDYSKNGRIEQEDLLYLSNHWKGTGNQEKSPEELIYFIDNWKNEYELDTPTPTITKTSTPTQSITYTSTPTLTPTETNTITYTPTLSPTPTLTLSQTPTRTSTNTLSQTPTPTKTNTDTFTPTNTLTLIPTPTQTFTKTNTRIPTKTNTPTITNTPTLTPTLTYTYTPTLTSTPTPFYTPIPFVSFEVNMPGLPEDARKMKMIKIPTGSFMMGAMPDENPNFTDNWDYPQHQVNIKYDLYIQETETTQAQWYAVTGAWPTRKSPSEKYGIGNNYPIYGAIWKEAKDFTLKLSQITGLNFRLPSEAEFEYAHRANTTTRYFFGNSQNCVEREFIYDDEGNILDWEDPCEDCSADTGGTRADYSWNCYNTNKSQEVGTKMYNQFGLFDMAGNVSEWCLDSFYWTYEGAPTDGSPWINPADNEYAARVTKGGNFNLNSLFGRIPKRMGGAGPWEDIGFRTVMDNVNKQNSNSFYNKFKSIEEEVNEQNSNSFYNKFKYLENNANKLKFDSYLNKKI